MSRFFDGYTESRRKVFEMSEAELYELIDALYGRDELPTSPTLDQLRQEALRQHRIDWTDTTSPEYESSEFWAKVAKIQRDKKRRY